MPAAVVAGVVGAVGTAYAAHKKSSAAKDAANTQAQAAGDANRLQLQMFNQARADNEPFRQNALTAQNEYMALLGLAPQQAAQGQPQVSGTQQANSQGPYTQGVYANNPLDRRIGNPKLAAMDPLREMLPNAPTPLLSMTQAQPTQQTPALTPQQSQQAAFDRFRNTPGYQFGLQTGFDQVQASAAARGSLMSGATLKALQRFGNDYADQQGYTPYMNRLASLAGMGQTINSQNAQLGMNYANQAGNNLLNAATARASGLRNSADAWGDAAGDIGGIAGWLAGQYNQPASTGLSNYNWATSSGFGNNWGNF